MGADEDDEDDETKSNFKKKNNTKNFIKRHDFYCSL